MAHLEKVTAVALRGSNLKLEKKNGLIIERNISEARMAELGVLSWFQWPCEVKRMPWTISEWREVSYIREGRVIVEVKGKEGSVEIGPGDLITFPAKMEIIWEVVETVDTLNARVEPDDEL
eukprot:c15244_g1_i1 orf=221-583(+)